MSENTMYEPHRFINNAKCKYFPCHDLHGLRRDMFNCLFCYCPLYRINDCGGNPKFIESNGKRIKDCSDCILPHRPEMYEYINMKLSDENCQPPKDKISEFRFLKIVDSLTQNLRVCNMIIITMIGTKERPVTSRAYRIKRESFEYRLNQIHENILELNQYDTESIELTPKIHAAIDTFGECVRSIEGLSSMENMSVVIPATWAVELMNDVMLKQFLKLVNDLASHLDANVAG